MTWFKFKKSELRSVHCARTGDSPLDLYSNKLYRPSVRYVSFALITSSHSLPKIGIQYNCSVNSDTCIA